LRQESFSMQKQTQTRALVLALIVAMLAAIVFGFLLPAARS
jgi:hypothetical protein